MRCLVRAARAALLAALVCACKPPSPSPPLRVAAASDLESAFTAVGAAYEKKTGQKVTFSFQATGLLEKQIAEGAPFDVFAAANVSFVDDAVAAGACYADSKQMYARGRVVMWVAKGDPPATVADLADPKWQRIALANPDHAPYGKAAQQAMKSAGILDAMKAKLVFGENVRQTFQFAQSGNADVAFVALSLATDTKEGKYTPVPAELHEPIDQAIVACKGAAAQASGAPNAAQGSSPRAFIAYVSSPEGRAIMNQYGFVLPGESVAGMK
jgi:molybdate transport system substrate-binding protein